ncbi:MAG: flagellar protein [Lachnospiraceae bacterium]
MQRLNISINTYNRPTVCSKCGGLMIFAGVGEYHCEECKHVDYDDYGKVRLYIESHRGATAAQIEEAIGVEQKAIRQMIRESRLEISAESRSFLKCDICGQPVRSGRYCPKCEAQYHKELEEEERERRAKLLGKGIGMDKEIGEKGSKRFQRTDRHL